MEIFWSKLDEDLLVEIAKRVKLYEDFVSFSRVCKSWRSAAVLEIHSMCKIPWLMLRLKTDTITFFSISKGFSRHVNLPKKKYRCSRYFSSKGWLIEIESLELTVSLFHPFSLRQLQLPSINCIPNSNNDWTNNIHDSDVGIFVMIKCVLSPSFSPDSDSDSQEVQVMVIHGSKRKLAYARPGDKVWRKMGGRKYFDVIYYRDQFYAINDLGQIFAIRGDMPVQIAKSPTEFIQVGDHVQCLYYLVESDGALLVVSRKEVVKPDRYFPYIYTTSGFNVFEVDLSNNKWTKMESLGSRSLFLGLNSSFSIDSSNNFYCKPNCIYFIDDFVKEYWYNDDASFEQYMQGGGKDMGIYNMKDGSIEPLFQGNPSHRFEPLMWIE